MLGTRFGRVLPLRVGIGFLVLALTLLAAVHGAPWTLHARMSFMGVGLTFALAALGRVASRRSGDNEYGRFV